MRLRSHRIPCSCIPAPLFHISLPRYTLRTSIAPPLQHRFKLRSRARSLLPGSACRLYACIPSPPPFCLAPLAVPLSRLADFARALPLHVALPLRLVLPLHLALSLRLASLPLTSLAKLSQALNVIKTGYRTSRVWIWSSENGHRGGVDQPSPEWY
ncbi:hypothetical protein B0H13DRAFT_2377583 [Mycena leptocephala]|nr:hypothetical protein B0H13DRAFT_2377583 [Mycena leptocephala]